MSAEVKVHDRTSSPGAEATLAELIEEMRLLQESIERHRARAELSRSRSEGIWREIERLKEETRPLMAEIRALR